MDYVLTARGIFGVLGGRMTELYSQIIIYLTNRWGNSKIVRFSPRGEINLEVHFPTTLNVTACCFGGRIFTYLYSVCPLI